MMIRFQYHPNILADFPAISGGVLIASGMTNGTGLDRLKEAFQAEQQASLARFGSTPLSEIASLAAWRSAFRAFGVNPTRYRSATEALLRRLIKKGDIPSINAIVDICNLVSIRYALPAASFDTARIHGSITVRYADGSEHFRPLFEQETEHPEPGEVIFIDESGLVVARRWCWRQSDESATREGTTRAIFTIEAHHPGGQTDVQAALNDLQQLLAEFVGGEYQARILNMDCPRL